MANERSRRAGPHAYPDLDSDRDLDHLSLPAPRLLPLRPRARDSHPPCRHLRSRARRSGYPGGEERVPEPRRGTTRRPRRHAAQVLPRLRRLAPRGRRRGGSRRRHRRGRIRRRRGGSRRSRSGCARCCAGCFAVRADRRHGAGARGSAAGAGSPVWSMIHEVEQPVPARPARPPRHERDPGAALDAVDRHRAEDAAVGGVVAVIAREPDRARRAPPGRDVAARQVGRAVGVVAVVRRATRRSRRSGSSRHGPPSGLFQ